MMQMKNAAALVLKLGITSLLVYLLVSRTDIETIGSILGRTDARWIAAAMLLQLVSFLLSALRWWLLARCVEPTLSLRAVLPSYFLGLFANNFLPTSVGGDAVRIVHLSVLGYNAHALVSSAVIDRTIGVSCILLIGCTAVYFSTGLSLAARDIWLLATAITVLATTVIVLFSPGTALWLERQKSRHRESRFISFMLGTAVRFSHYRNHLWLLAGMLCITLLLQSIVILTFAMLAHSIGLVLPLGVWFTVIPVVILAANLPVSIGGLGVREGALVGLLSLFGADVQSAISLSLLFLLVLWVVTLPGGYIALNLKLHGEKLGTDTTGPA